MIIILSIKQYDNGKATELRPQKMFNTVNNKYIFWTLNVISLARNHKTNKKEIKNLKASIYKYIVYTNLFERNFKSLDHDFRIKFILYNASNSHYWMHIITNKTHTHTQCAPHTHIHLHKHTRILTKVGYPRDTYGLTLICKLNFIMKVGFLPPKPDSFFFFFAF